VQLSGSTTAVGALGRSFGSASGSETTELSFGRAAGAHVM